MSESVIELIGVSKAYKNVKAVDRVSFAVERGHIMGLIGPNGAGKTTILKLLANLAVADEGKISFFGSDEKLDESRTKMSFMLEEPIIDSMMHAKNNMKYVAYVKGLPDAEEQIKELLELVGLGDTGKKAARFFSLGMKQRLGIAMALLNNPEVLVLDEPMNGLDPEGIVEMRLLLKDLAEKRNVTILISSHLLAELSELCTDYTIINRGKLVEVGNMCELLKNNNKHIVLRTNKNEEAIALLRKQFAISNYKVMQNNEIWLYEFSENPEGISEALMEAGILILKFSCEGESLEQYYLSKVGGIND